MAPIKELVFCLEYAARGLWPGPAEDIAAFFLRAKMQSQYLQKEEISVSAASLTQQLYGFTPVYTPIFFEDKGLALWEGAALFMEERSEGRLAVLRLKRSLGKKGRFFFYSLDEILAHESLHAARVVYDEPLFEEILAYRSSPAKIRKYLGPLLQSPRQLYYYFAAASCAFLFDVITTLIAPQSYLMTPLVAVLFALGSFLRLAYLQWIFSKALCALAPLLKQGASPLAAISRLMDKEILALARGKKDMLKYFKAKACSELRLALFDRQFLQGKSFFNI